MRQPRTGRVLRELKQRRARVRKTVDLSCPPDQLGRTSRLYASVVQATGEAVLADLAGYLRQNFRADATYQGDLAALLARVQAKFPAGYVDVQLTSIARSVDELSFNKLSRVPGINPSSVIAGGEREIERFRRVNASLIRSVPQQIAQDVAAVLAEPGVRELHVNDVAKILEERFGVAESRAEFWARDQTLKLYARVQETRQRAAGVRFYEWAHNDDERVRGRPGGVWAKNGSNHWVLGGTVQTWDLAPITNPKTGDRNHPGHDYQCRCSAYPIFDGDPRISTPEPPSTTPEEDAAELVRANPLPPPRFEQPRVQIAVPAPSPIPAEEVAEARKRYLSQQDAVRDAMLSHPQLPALQDYTAEEYLNVNAMLRGEQTYVSTEEAKQKIFDTVRDLQKFLHEAPKFAGTVQRGMRLTEAQLADYTPGATILWRAFTSTSVLPDLAESFAADISAGYKQVLLRIRQRSGVAINRLSANEGEAEVLLPAGTKVRVLFVETGADGRTLVHLEEVND